MRLFVKLNCFQATNKEGGWTRQEYVNKVVTESYISVNRIDSLTPNPKTGGTFVHSLATGHTWDVQESPQRVMELINKSLPPGLHREAWESDDDDFTGDIA